MSRITKRDEAYWERYRTTPKAFASPNILRAMWAGTSHGTRLAQLSWITSARVAASGKSEAQRFERALLRRLSPVDDGMVFRPVRAIAIESSAGTTDLGQLMMSMGFFLVLAGAGLAGMLIRLSAQQRAAQMGLMLASGFTARTTALVIFAEGAVLAAAGTVLGVPAGIAYAAGVMQALRSWWMSALGASQLWLHVNAGSLVTGAICGLAVGSVSAGWAALGMRKLSALRLLSGWQSTGITGDSKRSSSLIAVVLAAVAAAAAAAGAVGIASPETIFFVSGALFLLAGLAAANAVMGRMVDRRMVEPSLRGLAIRNAAANRARSVTVIGLLACAAFIIVAVAANTRDFSRMDYTRRDCGTGGFALRAISSMPIHYDFGTPKGRANLGFGPEDERLFDGVRVVSFLMNSGDDISCLNPARVVNSRVLGVGAAMARRGGFRVVTRKPTPNSWAVLDYSDSAAVPVFGDSDSVTWNLHSGLGQFYSIPAADGHPLNLRFEGLIPGSIFASELLMSERNFRKAFPEMTEARYFLVDVPKGREEAVAGSLRRNLGRLGLDVRTTRDVLNQFIGVQNTYLSMFLALGGLGVILGTFGLVAVILRAALERRGEFALMMAQGFTRRELARLLAAEHAGLLVSGLGLGTAAALVAVYPEMASVSARVDWISMLGALFGILVVGLAACALAADRVARGVLIDALRGE